MLRFHELREAEVFVVQRVSGLFEKSKNPSLTLRVSFGFATLLAWSTRAKRYIKTHASSLLWLVSAFGLAGWDEG